jgi:hypothetical protein
MGQSRRRLPQRGVVVFIALVAALAMALSAAALMRVVDTTAAVTGNLGFMQSAIAAGDDAIEHAVAALFERGLVANPSQDDAPQGYFASRQPGENARGIPTTLQALAAYPPVAPVLDAGNGHSVRYVIERMCVAPGPGTADYCNVVPTSAALVDPPRVPLFRQTIRVDGPAGAAAFIQVFLADVPGARRIAWRTLAD